MADRSVAEVSREIERLEKHAETLEDKVHSLEIRLVVINEQTSELKSDVDSIYGHFSWIWRVVGGIVIGAAGAFVISGGLSP